jgi:hypothetical protein
MPWATSVRYSKAGWVGRRIRRLQESGISKELPSTAESPCTISAPCSRTVAAHQRTCRKPNCGTSERQAWNIRRAQRSGAALSRWRRRSKELSARRILVRAGRSAWRCECHEQSRHAVPQRTRSATGHQTCEGLVGTSSRTEQCGSTGDPQTPRSSGFDGRHPNRR